MLTVTKPHDSARFGSTHTKPHDTVQELTCCQVRTLQLPIACLCFDSRTVLKAWGQLIPAIFTRPPTLEIPQRLGTRTKLPSCWMTPALHSAWAASTAACKCLTFLLPQDLWTRTFLSFTYVTSTYSQNLSTSVTATLDQIKVPYFIFSAFHNCI